jgi:hypothetical protein
MSYLMHIAFDNAFRLATNTHYFAYRNVQFKLIQNNPRRWSDVLLAIVPDDAAAKSAAFFAAGEFLSALSWQNSSPITLRHVGGPGIGSRVTLRQARCRSFVFPELPYHGRISGYGISQIAHIENEQQRIALTLYREALSSNKEVFAFLLFWQILEVRHHDAVGWVNSVRKRQPKALRIADDIRLLPLAGRRLGEYLQEDCRHAIAHIRRKADRRALRFDDEEEVRRLAISTRIVRELAAYYIRAEMGVTDSLHLVRTKKHGFPEYVDEDYLRNRPTYPAYSPVQRRRS